MARHIVAPLSPMPLGSQVDVTYYAAMETSQPLESPELVAQEQGLAAALLEARR